MIKGNTILFIIIGVLLLIVFWQTCKKKPEIVPQKPTIVTVIDTFYKESKDSFIYVPKPVYVKKTDSIPAEFKPDSNYKRLRELYDILSSRYWEEKQYKDTIKLDSIGYVAIDDKLHENEIKSRKFTYSYKLPTVVKTTTIRETYKPKTQLFVGGFVSGSKTSIVNAGDVGLMLKDKKDNLYGVKVGMDITGNVNYGIGAYFKIKLKND